MRVLLVNSARSMRGGESQTLELWRRLPGRGIETALAVRSGSGLSDALPGDAVSVELGFEAVPLITPRRLRLFVRRWRPDIVHAQTSAAHTHALAACRGLAPLVVSRRTAFAGRPSPLTAYKYGDAVAHFIPISEAAARSLVSRGVPRERMTVVPSGIDMDRFVPGAGSGGDILVAGTAAAFEKEKGHSILLSAASLMKERGVPVRLLLAGEGKLETGIASTIAENDLDVKICRITGDYPLEDFLSGLDIYVLPSLEEGLSTALMAAMASGLPCAASRTGGIPEVTGEDAAILFDPGDAAGLAEAVERLAADRELREELARRGLERAGAFDIERTVDRTVEVYKKVLSRAL